LQAIARVNRLYEDDEGSQAKEFGYIIDYVGVLGELDQALTTYSALEGFEEATSRAHWPRSTRKPTHCRSAMPSCGTCSRR
jgi:type I site-specific restriction-modification system R (restriction) subunit